MKSAERFPRGRSRQKGVALLEVLVALLLFMFGILGFIGLQSAMTRAQTDSKLRADAAYLASEAVGQMWADMTNFASYDGSGCASQTRCATWQGKVAQTLPNGTGAITVDAASGNVTVTITWAVPTGGTHKYTTQTTVIKAAS